jgi:hypothetical protein
VKEKNQLLKKEADLKRQLTEERERVLKLKDRLTYISSVVNL